MRACTKVSLNLIYVNQCTCMYIKYILQIVLSENNCKTNDYQTKTIFFVIHKQLTGKLLRKRQKHRM